VRASPAFPQKSTRKPRAWQEAMLIAATASAKWGSLMTF